MTRSRGASEIRVRPVGLREIADLRERYRRLADCQIVRDSILPGALADPYLFEVKEHVAGYAGVWNKHFPGRIMEVFTLPEYRAHAGDLVRALAEAAGAEELEVQTNLLGGRSLVEECTEESWVENLLFEAGSETAIVRPDLTLRRRRETDQGPEGEWVVERGGRVLGAGGWLTHYNPPYVDLYMAVVAGARRRGVGSYLVQELRRMCSRAGHRVAARCDPTNEASRRTLERGGMAPCGQILAGRLRAADRLAS